MWAVCPRSLKTASRWPIVPIGDAQALGRSIARVLRDPALAAKLSEGAWARAPMFSIENTVNRTMDVYRELLAERVPA